MQIVLAGGRGHLGTILQRSLAGQHEITVLSRDPSQGVLWDGVDDGPWFDVIDGSDVVINLAGRTVDCRYHKNNLGQMFNSRIHSTQAIGRAIAAAKHPPPLWLQASTATIYAHTFDRDQDEEGELGGREPGVPDYWGLSVALAQAWEAAFWEAETPTTRRVALRTAIVMSPDRGGPFAKMAGLTRWGLGGPIAGGRQVMSWISDVDFTRAIEFVIDTPTIDGPVNVAAPNPLAQAAFAQHLRDALGAPLGLPATSWMVEVGAMFMGTDPELVLKSRRVVPAKLLTAGFSFEHPIWAEAAQDLVSRMP